MSMFDLGGAAVSSLFGAFGSQQAASGFKKAAGFADSEAALTDRSTAIQQQIEARKAYKTIGGQQSDIAGAGFAASGSALDLMRSSRQESALSNQLLSVQGQITAQGYRAEGESYRQQATGSSTSAIGGFLSAGLSIAGMFSDRRLKKDVQLIDDYRGLNIYEFHYIWDEPGAPKTVGLMAQEVQLQHPEMVFANDDGFLVIDIDALDRKVA